MRIIKKLEGIMEIIVIGIVIWIEVKKKEMMSLGKEYEEKIVW